MAWLTPTQLLLYVPEQTVGDLLSDTVGQTTPQYGRDEILAHPALLEQLDAAMGQVAAACLSGNRYSIAELDALTSLHAAHLRHVTAVVAIVGLSERRPGLHEGYIDAKRKQALEYLTQLRDGADLFSLGDGSTEGAAVPDMTAMTAVDYQELNTLGESRMFPMREDRVPRYAG
jgi:hypothetical protein